MSQPFLYYDEFATLNWRKRENNLVQVVICIFCPQKAAELLEVKC